MLYLIKKVHLILGKVSPEKGGNEDDEHTAQVDRPVPLWVILGGLSVNSRQFFRVNFLFYVVAVSVAIFGSCWLLRFGTTEDPNPLADLPSWLFLQINGFCVQGVVVVAVSVYVFTYLFTVNGGVRQTVELEKNEQVSNLIFDKSQVFSFLLTFFSSGRLVSRLTTMATAAEMAKRTMPKWR